MTEEAPVAAEVKPGHSRGQRGGAGGLSPRPAFPCETRRRCRVPASHSRSGHFIREHVLVLVYTGNPLANQMAADTNAHTHTHRLGGGTFIGHLINERSTRPRPSAQPSIHLKWSHDSLARHHPPLPPPHGFITVGMFVREKDAVSQIEVSPAPTRLTNIRLPPERRFFLVVIRGSAAPEEQLLHQAGQSNRANGRRQGGGIFFLS